MPIYEYQCDACGKRFEAIQKFADPPIDVCTKCGKGPVQRLLSAPAFQFKGSGWYVTDYAKKGSDSDKSADKTGKAEPKSDTGEAASTPEKSESKPATAESKPAPPSAGTKDSKS